MMNAGFQSKLKNHTSYSKVSCTSNAVVFYIHERCFILIEEAEMGNGGGGGRAVLPPLSLYKISVGRRARRGRPLHVPSCLRLPHPHKRNAVDLPTGRAPRVRRLALLSFFFVCKSEVRSFRAPKLLKQRSSSVPNGPCDRGPA